jgi:hypothetical protein
MYVVGLRNEMFAENRLCNFRDEFLRGFFNNFKFTRLFQGKQEETFMCQRNDNGTKTTLIFKNMTLCHDLLHNEILRDIFERILQNLLIIFFF